jgi:hypothetical protein
MASLKGSWTGPFLPGSTGGTQPTASSVSPSPPARPTPAQPAPTPTATPSPLATVEAYIAAINRHDYTLAWELGGKNLTSYQNFVATADKHDTLHIINVQGDTVTADVTATQANGTSRTSETIFTVTHGVITKFLFP